MSENSVLKVAAVQAAPVFLDRDATIQKACDLIETAGREGAKLVVFPEAFVPTYPFWAWEIPPRQNRLLSELYAALVLQSVTVPSDDTNRICTAAQHAGVHIAMGVSERNAEASNTSLFNTLLYIHPSGAILGKPRKLIPTGAERLVWTGGDGSTLDAYDTSCGKIGGLICWENYMPLARYAMYAWGVQILVTPTWDEGEPWLSTLRHIAKEGRVYVISPSIAMRKDDIPDRFDFKKAYYGSADEWFKKGDSAIVNPDGQFIAGPVRLKEEILYAEINLDQTRGSRWKLDVAGHYARPDVFRLTVNKSAHPMIEVSTDVVDDEGTPTTR
jgi:nitrilase